MWSSSRSSVLLNATGTSRKMQTHLLLIPSMWEQLTSCSGVMTAFSISSLMPIFQRNTRNIRPADPIASHAPPTDPRAEGVRPSSRTERQKPTEKPKIAVSIGEATAASALCGTAPHPDPDQCVGVPSIPDLSEAQATPNDFLESPVQTGRFKQETQTSGRLLLIPGSSSDDWREKTCPASRDIAAAR